jgi:hypothetical protein
VRHGGEEHEYIIAGKLIWGSGLIGRKSTGYGSMSDRVFNPGHIQCGSNEMAGVRNKSRWRISGCIFIIQRKTSNPNSQVV